MKVRFSHDGEEIEVDKIYISFPFAETEYKITEAAPAYLEDGNIVINKVNDAGSSRIYIAADTGNQVYIK